MGEVVRPRSGLRARALPGLPGRRLSGTRSRTLSAALRRPSVARDPRQLLPQDRVAHRPLQDHERGASHDLPRGLRRSNWQLSELDLASFARAAAFCDETIAATDNNGNRSEEHTSELQSPTNLVCGLLLEKKKKATEQNYQDRKSTRLNSSHGYTSYS